MAMGWFLDTTNDGYYDTEIKVGGNEIVSVKDGAVSGHQKVANWDRTALDKQIEAVAKSLGQSAFSVASQREGASLGQATKKQRQTEMRFGSGKTTEELGMGAAEIEMEDIASRNPEQAAEFIFETKYNNILPKGYSDEETFLKYLVGMMGQMPKPQTVDEDDLDFLERQKTISEGRAGIGYKAAGDVYGAAQEAYALGERSLERGLGTQLGGVQEQAYGIGQAPTTGAGARGRMRGQKKIKGGVEDIYGGFQESMAGLEGTMERAGSAYGRSTDIYGLDIDAAQLAYETGEKSLSDTAERIWESNFSTFLNELPSPN
jgi:hypothetical protein